MTIATRKRLITEDELIALGSDARVEVVNGEIAEMTPVGGLHHFVAGNINFQLETYARTKQTGYAFMDGLIYLLSREGGGLRGARVPDASFVRKEDIPSDWDIKKPFPGTPTLAVEVMSPDDDMEEVVKKVNEYLDAGSEQVWVVLPEQKQVYQYHQGDPTVTTYSGDDAMDVEALLPGLVLKLEDIFRLPDLG